MVFIENGVEKGSKLEDFVHASQKRFNSVRGYGRHFFKGREPKRSKTNGKHNANTLPTPPLDLVWLERTQRESKPNSCKKTTTCSNLSSQQVLSNSNLAGRDPTRTPSSDLTIWKDVRRSAWKSSVNWKAIESCTFKNFPLFVWVITNSKDEELGERERELENFQKFVASRSECVCYARIGRPDTFMIGRSPERCYHKVVTNAWSDWFPTFICELSTDNIVMLATALSIVDKDFSKSPILQGDLRDSKYKCPSLVLISWTCKQQAGVFTEQHRSVDAALRLERIPALNLWDVVGDFLECPTGTDPIRNTKFPRRNFSWRIIGERIVLTVFFKLTHLQSKIVCVCFRRCCDQNYHKRPEPVHGTYLPNPPCEPESVVGPRETGCWKSCQTRPHTWTNTWHFDRRWPQLTHLSISSHRTSTPRVIYQLNFACTE